jgi:hypothetical protein
VNQGVQSDQYKLSLVKLQYETKVMCYLNNQFLTTYGTMEIHQCEYIDMEIKAKIIIKKV